LLALSGCGDTITGKVTASLSRDNINNGETVTLKINGKNTGNIAADVLIKISSENPNKVIISYSGALEERLQPNEQLGDKLVNVQGFTDYSSTKYAILTQIVNKADGTVLDQNIQYLTVNKNR
jgi:hypothetical protein